MKLSRRAMLRGMGSVAIGLPVLDVMLNNNGDAFADTTPLPQRYFVGFMGQSLGADNDSSPSQWIPDNMGTGYDLKPGLAPIAAVQDLITIVSGLKIPYAQQNGGMIPAGGRSDNFHIQSLCPLLTGMRNVSATSGALNGPTSDQIVGDAISKNQKFKYLGFLVQASWYLDQSAPYGRDVISARFDQNQNAVVPIPAIVSPKLAFDNLFMGGVPMDPSEIAREQFLLKERKSILDLIITRTDRLIPRLGNADRIKMQQHLAEIRDLERRILALPPVYNSTCKVPMDPGMDPPIGGNQNVNMFDPTKGYSKEDLRVQIFSDLVAMSFICDLTRSVALQYTMAQSHLNLFPAIGGAQLDVHELGHSGKTVDMTKAHAWHSKYFAYLVQKLRDTPEGNGSVIDNTVLLLLNEGGHGYDPEANRVISSHSTEEMAVLIAGKAGGLKPGKHVRRAGMHPVNVVNSAMQAVGVNVSLGEVSGIISDLFV